MSRHEFSRKTKRMAWERCNGHCEKCTAKLFPGKFAYDHIVPDQLGGSNELSNCQVLCAACHSAKTGATDVPTIRKSDRQRDKHIGAMRKSKWGNRGFPRSEPQRSATRPIQHRNEVET